MRFRVMVLTAALFFAPSAPAQRVRHFTFRYALVIDGVPPGSRLRVWVPLAHSDDFQRVRVVAVISDLRPVRTREARYGNWMLHAATRATAPTYRMTVEYDVLRREHHAPDPDPPGRIARPPAVPAADWRQALAPDQLVPVSGAPAELATEVTRGLSEPMSRARAIYDYVLRTMRYDKTGIGWGRGDALYACSARKGNCTDFHSLFIAMARSQQIPARFAIGFPIPTDRHAGVVEGYHCWSDFYVPGRGWVPVDVSEASEHPDKRDYYFGAHDANRVQFTLGRDLQLNPPQAGPPLNYFVYPYVEVDGKGYTKVSLDFSFADVNVPSASRP